MFSFKRQHLKTFRIAMLAVLVLLQSFTGAMPVMAANDSNHAVAMDSAMPSPCDDEMMSTHDNMPCCDDEAMAKLTIGDMAKCRILCNMLAVFWLPVTNVPFYSAYSGNVQLPADFVSAVVTRQYAPPLRPPISV